MNVVSGNNQEKQDLGNPTEPVYLYLGNEKPQLSTAGGNGFAHWWLLQSEIAVNERCQLGL